MKITKVTSNGIQRIIDGYKASASSFEKMTYGCKSDSFFENTEISLFISDVKGIELLALKKFCPSLIVIDNDAEAFTANLVRPEISHNVLRFPKEKTKEDEKRDQDLSNLSKKVYSLLKFIIKNEEDPSSDILSMLDIGSFQFKVIARFEGVNILSLLNAFPESVLYIRSKRDFVEEGTKQFENICCEQFVRNFFSYMENMMSGIDILTDVQFNDEFFKTVSGGNLISCTHIRNAFDEISMMNYNSPQELISVIEKIKTESSFLNYRINPEREFTYHFAVNASMETLLFFMSISNLVYYYGDLKAIAGVSSIFTVPDSLKLDESRVTFADAVNALDSWRLDALKKLTEEEKAKSTNKNTQVHYSRLELYNFIPRAAKIKFMMHGTEDDFNRIIEIIETNKKYKNYGEVSEIVKYIRNQFNLIKAIWNR